MVPDLLVVSIVELMRLQFAENCGHTLLERGYTPLIVKDIQCIIQSQYVQQCVSSKCDSNEVR